MKLKQFFLISISSILRMLRGEVSTKRLIKMGLTVGHTFRRQGGAN